MLPLTPGIYCLERVARIELANSPWQGDRLPLHHTRIVWWRWSGSNRLPLACKATALPDELHPQKFWHSIGESNPSSHRERVVS